MPGRSEKARQLATSEQGAGLASDSEPKSPERRRPGRPRLAKPSPEFLARREQIVDAAARVFRERGYDAGTLDDVAAALNLRQASLYYYVRSKAHLLYLIFDRAMALALEHLEGLGSLGDPGERLRMLIRHQVTVVAQEPSLFTVFFDHRPHLDDAYSAEIRAKERRYFRVFVEAVRDAVAAGMMPPVNPRYGAQALLGMTNWVYKWFDPQWDNLDRLADDFARLVPVISGRYPDGQDQASIPVGQETTSLPLDADRSPKLD